MRISILQGSDNGSSVYTETQKESTNVNGLISIQIGMGTSSDDFSEIDWSNGPYFIKTETDPEGSTNYSIIGTSELMSVFGGFKFVFFYKSINFCAMAPSKFSGL